MTEKRKGSDKLPFPLLIDCKIMSKISMIIFKIIKNLVIDNLLSLMRKELTCSFSISISIKLDNS